jgi:hypothetical protein
MVARVAARAAKRPEVLRRLETVGMGFTTGFFGGGGI